MNFYWECLNQDYQFISNENYLIYFKGCFCPPSRGHFDTVKKFIDMGYNFHVMIHQSGSESRHGVSYSLNKKIWEIYIDELLPSDRVNLIKYGSYDDIITLIDNSDIKYDKVIYIRGNENYNIDDMERSTLRIYKRIIRRLARRNIELDFIFLDRLKAHKLSASKFIQTLIKYKRYTDRDKYKERLLYFLPKYLSEESINYILKELIKCWLK